MKHIIFNFLLILVFMLAACGNSAEEESIPVAAETVSVVGTELSISPIAPIPDSFPRVVRNNFDRYTQVIAPNGKPINFYAQANLSEAQIIQARNTLIFWLTDVPGSQFGADKTAVANKMGDNEASLMLLNGADGDSRPPNLSSQTLYENELVVPGSAWYINNDFEHRDATFEEILHLVHDTGIGVDGPNTQPGVLPDFQTEIRAATDNAVANNFQIWPTTAKDDRDTKAWYDELSGENSLTQEYLAAVIDSYYGLWGPFDEDGGMWGFYIAKTRADIETSDPLGYELMRKFFSPYLTYNAHLDPSFDGTFTMTFDADTPYTHKSQYLLHATLAGSNHANLTGNDQDNQLQGNSGNNVLTGNDGDDVALFVGNKSEYTITINDENGRQTVPVTVTVTDSVAERDGVDTLQTIEQLQFADETVTVEELSSEMPTEGNAVYLPLILKG